MEPTPFTILIDTREQRNYAFVSPFATIAAGTKTVRRPHAVRTLRGTLRSGDYSLVGFESRVAVERKSKEDLFNTLGQGRDRFEREIARLNEMEFAAVVVEAEWAEIFADPPARSMLLPKTILASVAAWQQRFPRVHWWFVPGRDVGEAVTLKILDRFWRDVQAEGAERGTIQELAPGTTEFAETAPFSPLERSP
jgi:DNA excision repair protein ERCC-4